MIERVRAAGLRYCPHYLGAGVGLAASAHLLAAVGGDGMLEVDANPNPLRSGLCPSLESVRDGRALLEKRRESASRSTSEGSARSAADLRDVLTRAT